MDPATIAAFGSVLSGMGSLGSAVSGVFGKSGVRDTLFDQLRKQRESQQKYDKWKSENFGTLAKNMGVSRYALLGNASNPVPAQIQPESYGDSRFQRAAEGLSQFGQDVGRGVQARMALQEHKARLGLIEAQTAETIARANKLNATQKPLPLPQINTPPKVKMLDPQITKSAPGNAGVEAGGRSGQIITRDRHGYVTFDLNQELAEARESQGASSQIINEARDFAQDMWESLKGRGGREPTRKLIQDEMVRSGKMDPSREQVEYDVFWGVYKIVPRRKGPSRKRIQNQYRFRSR